MDETDAFTDFPRTLRASTAAPDVLYRLRPDLIAVHGGAPPPTGWEIVLTLEDPPIVVCRGDPGRPPPPLSNATLTPVYALGRDGAPAVPTGLVLVRFHEGLAAAERSGLLAGQGYSIHDLLPYAPSAVRVMAVTGGIPASLRGIPALEALPEVVNVEPQMVRRADRR